MNQTRLRDVLSGAEGNYILPFFWQHGEDEATLRAYMAAIHGANIGAVCVEARPHPDFAGPKWWEDLDIIMDEARARNMKVWVLNDAHFPTGQAAGKMEDAPEELCKQYLAYHERLVCGPLPESMLDVAVLARHVPNPFQSGAADSLFAQPEPRVFTDDVLFAVVAAKLSGVPGKPMGHLDGAPLDLTDRVQGGRLFWDVPAGLWKVYVIYTTRNGGGATNYINMLSPKSCRVQIDAVYEPHYARYQADFGKTFAGFFSDEPAVGNTQGFSRDVLIGAPNMPLPWSEGMPGEMAARFGVEYRRMLPALWAEVGEKAFTAEMRVGYMDIVTRLIRHNFGEQIGAWCRARGVEYIGHIIEDCDMSVRLGASMGHFFRALRGQDMSGIDNIGGQVQPGCENRETSGFLGLVSDGEFYHNALGKLGASLAHIDPKKKGRAMCEIFGAYGWAAGTRLMKYLADHFLVRGINRFVPHAFSPRPFPDHDCPPHFYAHGENPLYKPFGALMRYMNRLSHLFDGGAHRADVALLYHAEMAWSGAEYQTFHGPARSLLENQIDFDVIPADVFSDMEGFSASFDGTLHICRERFRALVIPGARFVPDAVLDFAREAVEVGFPVYITDIAPEALPAGCTVCALAELPGLLRARGIYDISLDSAFPNLRFYHYEQMDEIYYMFSNEDMWSGFEGYVTLPARAVPYRYDALENRLYALPHERNGNGICFSLRLEPYESTVIVLPQNDSLYAACAYAPGKPIGAPVEIPGPWRVSFSERKPYTEFGGETTMDSLHNVLPDRPGFSGVICYETVFTRDNADGAARLTLEDAYESAEVRINGVHAGLRLCPPYRFDIGNLLRPGENSLVIEVSTTLAQRAWAMQPNGIMGPEAHITAPSGIVGKVFLQSFRP